MQIDLSGLSAAAGPWFALALVLLSIAGRVAVNQRRSATGQGQRIGRVEGIVEAERTRRRQVEAELIACGIPLPYWPSDPLPPNLRYRDRRSSGDEAARAADGQEDFRSDVDEDLDYDEPLTTEQPRIPVPPLPAGIGSRHRRTP